jgi:hypothetical protein
LILQFALIGLLCGILGFRLGWRTRDRWALPALQGAIGFVAFAIGWRYGGPIAGAVGIGGWVLGSTLYSLIVFQRDREQIDRRVLHARAYREARVASWPPAGGGLRSIGASWRRHLRALAVLLLLALLTANLLSMIVAAVLLNAMNAYVAVMLHSATRPWTVRLLGWDSWNVVRATAYVMLCSACATPLATRLGYPASAPHVRWLLVMGLLGLALGWVLELLLGRSCSRLISKAVELGPRTE